MGNITAYKAIILERNVDYRPHWVNTSPGLHGLQASAANGAGYYDQAPVHAMLMMLAPSAGTPTHIRLWFMGAADETDYVDIVIAAWSVGVVIEGYLWKYTIMDTATENAETRDEIILGYKGKNMPLELS
jgi:hypothetical protein